MAGGQLDDAVEWLSQHQEDADIDHELTFEQAASLNLLRRKQVLPAPLAQAIDNGICTFAVSGKTFVPQRWYKCQTCKLIKNEGCCESCALTCHAGQFVWYRIIIFMFIFTC